jgi:hypothetical protein
LSNIIKHAKHMRATHIMKLASSIPWDEEAPEDGDGDGHGGAGQTISFWEPTCGGQWHQVKEADAEKPGKETDDGR